MKKLLYIYLGLSLMFGCSDDSDNTNCPDQPQITTYDVSQISYDEVTDLVEALFTAEIQNTQLGANCETFSVTNQGFVYGVNIQPTIDNNVVNVNGQNPSFTANNLIAETTYYVRAYLTNVLGTFYGNEVSFTTPQSTIPIYLDSNGITIKARDWANVGDTGVINGIEYTIISEYQLRNMIVNNDNLTMVCTTKVTDMSLMFYQAASFNQNISSWDVSNVTSMYGMFAYAYSFNQPLNNWDVSNVTNMGLMLHATGSFNLPLNNWDVSNVIQINNLFSISQFNQDIGNWDVSNVTVMEDMFNGNTIFNQDISNWDVSNVTSMSSMFNGALNINQNLSYWDVSNVTQCGYFSDNTPQWTLPQPNFTNCNPD